VLQLGIGHVGGTVEGFDRGAQVVLENALDAGQNVGCHVVGEAAFLAVVDVGRLGEMGVHLFEEVDDGEDAAGGLGEGGLGAGGGPGGGGGGGAVDSRQLGMEVTSPVEFGLGGRDRLSPGSIGWETRRRTAASRRLRAS
jgi:hypothetical protein